MCIGGMILDGTGSGKFAKVGSDNRLAASAVAKTIEQQSIANGDGFNIATDRITLTSSSESAVFYIKNQEEFPLVISSVFLNTINGAGTLSGQPVLKVYRNPDAGTIISSPISVPASLRSNSNFGSNDDLVALIYEGAEGKTISGQNGLIDIPLPSRQVMPLANFPTTVVLPKGASYAMTYTPELGTTSVQVIAGITLFRLSDEVS